LRFEAPATKVVVVALRCLIVDDSREYASAAARRLRSEGVIIVGQATSTSEAIAVAEEAHPDVALVDVQLGEESGVDVARVFADRVPTMRVILISTHSRDDLAELLAEVASVCFLDKAAVSAVTIAECLR
jgi:ActR/RegA family two-component response regulator